MIIFNKDKALTSIVLFFIITSIISCYLLIQIFKTNLIGSYGDKKQELSHKIVEYENVKSDLSDYENKIRALSPKTLDKDFLEEKAREKLNYNKKNEVVIFK
ncbi:MAG: septum formation initiator family protein [Rickettsiales bacterium]|nr:septum formation initiator family protein [Rickettsiales bacterium]